MCGWRKEENFIQQQIFGLDFDGTITFEEFKIRSEMLEIRPVFVYKTLNYCEEDKRFRVVYINDCTIEKCEHAKLVLRLLLHLFPEADKQCEDVARFFLVGKGLLEYN